MTDAEQILEQVMLPMDVMQTVLGYVSDTKSMAAARQVCKAWHAASAAATATVSVNLPGGIQDMRSKLALLLHVMPNLGGCNLFVGSGAAADYPAECFRQLLSFPALKSLELRFSDSLDLNSSDITHLACLTGLTRLNLHNVSLVSQTDSSPLLLLKDLAELSLVHQSKVSALLVGDKHLAVLGSMTSLSDLVLQGRMCSTSDSGLLALSGLTRLHSLAMSWVPWQSQITQAAALQLLSALKSLKTLQLGGAELLLPSTPQVPIAAAHALPGAPAPAAAPEAQQTAVLLPQLSTAMSLTSATAAAASQTDLMRSLLLAKAMDLEQFKLQFNCCGTGVEKALLALGEVCGKLTGLQWSYAKLSGPNSIGLLASCTSLTSLKLRLWYQDYNLRPFKLNLAHLSTLTKLRSIVIDKRPPFQQQLPVQQGAISIPLTPEVLNACSASWQQLQKLQLGLSRSDFGATPLQGLSGFTQLKSLSVHCYDQGFDDGQYMLPVDITCLPSSLLKIDLMHAELFSSSTDQCGDRCTQQQPHGSRTGSASSSCKRDALAGGCSTTSISSNSFSSSCAASGAGSSGGSMCCSNGGSFSKPPSKVSFAAASAHAFTSMLSESFSVLSRQASLDVSYLDQVPGVHQLQHQQQQQQQQQQVQAYYAQLAQQQQEQQEQLQGLLQQAAQPPVVQPTQAGAASAFASAHGVAAAAAAASHGSTARLAGSSTFGAPVESHASWLHDLMHSLPPIASDHSSSSSNSSIGSGLGSLPVPAPAVAPPVARAASSTALPRQLSLPPLPEQRAVAAHLHSGSAGLQPHMPALQLSRAAANRKNPFAAAAAAAAVHEAIGGCVAAVDPALAAASGAEADDDCGSRNGRDQQDKLPVSHSSNCGSSSSNMKRPNKLVGSYSVAHAATSSSNKAAAADGEVLMQRAFLPHLQQLQLKHCALLGVTLDDVITKPLELRVLQLIEVVGLCPRDIALLPYLASLHRLTLIAAKEDSWLGLAPLRLFAKLPELRHLDWVVSEKALSGRHSKAPELQALAGYPKLQVLTVHTLLGRSEQLHAVSAQLRAGCAVRLMTPAFCEHATKRSGFGIGKLLGVASCLLSQGTAPVL